MSVLPSRARSVFRDLPWADAGHAAIVSAAPAIAAVLFGEPRLGWSAIAAFWTCFADPGGPLPRRLQAMGWVAVIGALYCFLGSSAQHILWLLLPLTFVCCTLASFAQVWGPAAAIIGTLVSAGFVVSTELPTPTMSASAAYASFFIGGGVWSIVMTAVVWRRKPWRHATAAVAQCYIEIAAYAGALGLLYLPSRGKHSDAMRGNPLARSDDEDGNVAGSQATFDATARWTAVSDVHRKALRAQIETAKKRVREVLGSRPSRRDRGQQLLALIDAAEHAFVVLVALADTMASVSSASASASAPLSGGDAPIDVTNQRLRDAALLRVLHRFAQACNVIAKTSNVEDAAQRQAMQNALTRTDQAVRQAHAVAQSGDVTLPALLPLLDRLFGAGADALSALLSHISEAMESYDADAAASALDTSTSSDSSVPAPASRTSPHTSQATPHTTSTKSATTPPWLIGLRQLRGNLHSRSSICRHAIRVGVAATVSVALCNFLNINHGYWMSLTVVFILQPYLASTWQRTAERILGSVVGAVGASLVGALLPSPLAVALAVLPIALGTFVGRTIHYAIFTFFLTLQFVLVAEIQQPAVHEFTLAGLRAMNSVYGGVLALVIGMVLWPERSSQRLASVLAEAVDKHAWYVRAVLQSALSTPTSSAFTGASSLSGAPASTSNKPEKAEKDSGDSMSKDGGRRPSLSALRRDACLAADNAQLVLQSLMRSPLHRQHGADNVARLIASLRGMTAAATVLELQPLASHDVIDKQAAMEAANSPDALAEYVQRVGVALEETASRIRRDDGQANGAKPSGAETFTTPIHPPAEVMRPADPRSLALQRLSRLAQAVEDYRTV